MKEKKNFLDRIIDGLRLTKYREIIMYLIFGVLTTLVGWAVYYGILAAGRAVFAIPTDDVSSGKYIAIYTAAQVIQWICAVLFAFFTNKKWVFTTADQSVSTGKQLVTFAGSRLVTFGLDYVITFAGTFALAKLFPSLVAVFLLGKERNLAEILSKVVAAVVVIICNYIISKLLVFKKRKSEEKPLE